MKKLFFGLVIMFAALLSSCNGCKQTTEGEVRDSVKVESVQMDAQLNVEHIIAMDRQDMYNKVGGDYRWFETCMRLNDFLDEENDGSLAEIVNVFQAVINRGEGFDTKVYKFQHFSDGVNANDSIIGFWVEDFPLNEEEIKVSYQEAYNYLMAVNMPKPHSRYVTLRKQVGPKACNAQYIFGNVRAQIYVDAVTGEVRDYNPAFGKPEEAKGFTMPLGEWP